jgi:hypothetical protein
MPRNAGRVLGWRVLPDIDGMGRRRLQGERSTRAHFKRTATESVRSAAHVFWPPAAQSRRGHTARETPVDQKQRVDCIQPHPDERQRTTVAPLTCRLDNRVSVVRIGRTSGLGVGRVVPAEKLLSLRTGEQVRILPDAAAPFAPVSLASFDARLADRNDSIATRINVAAVTPRCRLRARCPISGSSRRLAA